MFLELKSIMDLNLWTIVVVIVWSVCVTQLGMVSE